MLEIGINMKTKGLILTGYIVTNTMFKVSQLEGVSFENLFQVAIQKMKRRDKRYHGVSRLE